MQDVEVLARGEEPLNVVLELRRDYRVSAPILRSRLLNEAGEELDGSWVSLVYKDRPQRDFLRFNGDEDLEVCMFSRIAASIPVDPLGGRES